MAEVLELSLVTFDLGDKVREPKQKNKTNIVVKKDKATATLSGYHRLFSF